MIRQAGPDDLYTILRLEEESFPWEAWSSYVFRRELASDETLFLLYEDGGKALGYIMAFLDESNRQAHIGSIAVTPARRRKGIAAAMLEELLTRCRRQGMTNFRAETRKSSWHVRALFGRFGFQEVSILKQYYDTPKEDAVLLLLEEPPM